MLTVLTQNPLFLNAVTLRRTNALAGGTLRCVCKKPTNQEEWGEDYKGKFVCAHLADLFTAT
jgi:hypothetical protein